MEKRMLFTGERVGLTARADGRGDTITGYGAVFYDGADPGTEYRLWSDTVERVMPGAFDRSLREDDVRSLFNHDSNYVLGRRRPGATDSTLRLSIDGKGLLYFVDPPAARADVIDSVRRGDVDGSSIMFVPLRTVWIEQKSADENTTLYIRQIEEVELWETGPVVFPAYESTTSDLRSRYESDVRAEREAWLAGRESATGSASARESATGSASATLTARQRLAMRTRARATEV